MRPLPWRVVVRKLRSAGFTETSQKGSHVKFVKETETGRVVVPVPGNWRVANCPRAASSYSAAVAIAAHRRTSSIRSWHSSSLMPRGVIS